MIFFRTLQIQYSQAEAKCLCGEYYQTKNINIGKILNSTLLELNVTWILILKLTMKRQLLMKLSLQVRKHYLFFLILQEK